MDNSRISFSWLGFHLWAFDLRRAYCDRLQLSYLCHYPAVWNREQHPTQKAASTLADQTCHRLDKEIPGMPMVILPLCAHIWIGIWYFSGCFRKYDDNLPLTVVGHGLRCYPLLCWLPGFGLYLFTGSAIEESEGRYSMRPVSYLRSLIALYVLRYPEFGPWDFL